MIEGKADLERTYAAPDPWGFTVNPEDRRRKTKILETLDRYAPLAFRPGYRRALDIGAGEGWITKDLPAGERHAFEISDRAKRRLPDGVIAARRPEGGYDLVTATGVLYSHYDFPLFFGLMREHATDVVLTCNVKTWNDARRGEVACIADAEWVRDWLGAEQIHHEEFPYRSYVQVLRVLRRVRR